MTIKLQCTCAEVLLVGIHQAPHDCSCKSTIAILLDLHSSKHHNDCTCKSTIAILLNLHSFICLCEDQYYNFEVQDIY